MYSLLKLPQDNLQEDFLSNFTTPVAVVIASDDQICSNEKMKMFFEKANTKHKQLATFESCHYIMSNALAWKKVTLTHINFLNTLLL